MATSNDRAILNSIINPLLPNPEFEAFNLSEETSEETEAVNEGLLEINQNVTIEKLISADWFAFNVPENSFFFRE